MLCRVLMAFILGILLSPSLMAGKADVLSAQATKEPAGAWRFTVTVKDADQGWNHYANEFRISGPNGEIYGTRTLYHPHVNEQPFTRNLSGVRIPDNVKSVTISAGDSVHGYGGEVVTIDLQ